MAILDMQDMKPEARNWGGCAGSDLSVALCDSVASITLCL
jgi:Lanthionine-containing peptide SapB precursor RamS